MAAGGLSSRGCDADSPSGGELVRVFRRFWERQRLPEVPEYPFVSAAACNAAAACGSASNSYRRGLRGSAGDVACAASAQQALLECQAPPGRLETPGATAGGCQGRARWHRHRDASGASRAHGSREFETGGHSHIEQAAPVPISEIRVRWRCSFETEAPRTPRKSPEELLVPPTGDSCSASPLDHEQGQGQGQTHALGQGQEQGQVRRDRHSQVVPRRSKTAAAEESQEGEGEDEGEGEGEAAAQLGETAITSAKSGTVLASGTTTTATTASAAATNETTATELSTGTELNHGTRAHLDDVVGGLASRPRWADGVDADGFAYSGDDDDIVGDLQDSRDLRQAGTFSSKIGVVEVGRAVLLAARGIHAGSSSSVIRWKWAVGAVLLRYIRDAPFDDLGRTGVRIRSTFLKPSVACTPRVALVQIKDDIEDEVGSHEVVVPFKFNVNGDGNAAPAAARPRGRRGGKRNHPAGKGHHFYYYANGL